MPLTPPDTRLHRYSSVALTHLVFSIGLVSAPHPKLRLRELGPQIFIILRGDSREDQD